ncbi:MAG: LEA type 2 family protein [Casimicrobiaceae bacterium]
MISAAGCVPAQLPFEQPQVTLETVRILRFADSKADVMIGMRITNPNPYALPVDRVEFDVILDGRSAASGRTVRVDKLQPRGEAKVDVSGRVDVAAVATGLMSIGSQLPLPYAIKGTITLDDGTALPFAHTGRITVGRFDSVGPRAQ